MPQPLTPPARQRTCEENRARRAWASAHGRRPAILLQTLSNLLPVLQSPRPVYARIARNALRSGNVEAMLNAVDTVCTEIAYCRRERAKLYAHYQIAA